MQLHSCCVFSVRSVCSDGTPAASLYCMHSSQSPLPNLSAVVEQLGGVQVQYSLLSQGKLQQATKAACDDLGLKLIAYSPLALGMLTGRYTTTGEAVLPSGTHTREAC